MGKTIGKFENSECRLNWRGEIALLAAIKENNILPLHELRPYLWQDEIGDPFLLTSWCEIYLYSGYDAESINNPVVTVLIFSRRALQNAEKLGIFSKYDPLSDGIHRENVLASKIGVICGMKPQKKRMPKGSKKLKRFERLLGHRILPYSPGEISNPIGGTIPAQLCKSKKLLVEG